MGNATLSAQELAKLSKTLPEVLRRMDSVEKLEAWFRSQPYVAAVDSPDYLIKTAPPRKELFVQFKMNDGSRVMRAIVVTLYPDQTFSLADIYEP
ncbi:hypothetical protein [Egbenema bharatensis]|uniref:hypothetical protein n=1 Tax=Egbenema bharatensis TaxID=3463334 RepID=UPI003A8853C6